MLKAEEPRFVDRTEALGIDFEHHHFGTGEKYMPENMGAGVAIFDADGDGRLDLYFVQGSLLGVSPEAPPRAPAAKDQAMNRLFRQRADGTFADVTSGSGAGHSGYGMGVTWGDFDGDGDPDLYLTNFGPNALLRNRGDGTFEDITAQAGVGDPRWSTGATFFDADGDGDLDLYVANYVNFAFDHHKWCGNAQRRIRSYCHPDVYEGLGDTLYRNEGSLRFTDISQEAGILKTADDKGLGVLAADLDGDGRQDLYVANDSTMNYLYLGRGAGNFEESALLAGAGFNGSGAAEASMGLALGDFDGRGTAEIFVTHLDLETNTLYRPQAPGLYADATERSGLAGPGLPWVGFGTVSFDHDHDGDLDLFVANGHILDNIALFDPTRSHRQPAQLLDNRGNGTFRDLSSTLGLPEPLVGRGAATGDLDGDGDLDLVITQNGGPARVLINQIDEKRHQLTVRLRGTTGNPDGFGARLELTVGKRTLVRFAHGAGSYLSQGAPEIHFGLGEAAGAEELVVFWPSGRVSRMWRLVAGREYVVRDDG